MIELIVNGAKTQTPLTNLKKFLVQNQLDNRKFAVAVNETFIAKKNYSLVELCDGDQIEILEPMQGG